MSTSKPPNPNGEAGSGSATPAAPSESTSKVVASSVERHNPFEQLESPVASPPRSQNSQSTNRSTVMSPDSALPVKSRPTGAPSSEVSAVAATAAAAAMATAPTATATTPGRSSSPSVSSLGTAGSLTVPSPARSNADSTPHRRASPGRTTSPTAASVQDQHPQFSNGGQGPHNTSLDEDDSLTEQSTAGNTMDQQSYSSGNTAPAAMTGAATSSLGRLIESTKRMGINRQRSTPASDDDADFDAMGGALLCGYLEKLGRNGKWQRRWFETDGECLSYYKSKKRTRVLATLDLEKVGNIEIDSQDENRCSFYIQVLGRVYNLRAESRGVCMDWVIMLNRVKEARLQQGNVKLVNHGVVPDLLSGNAGKSSVTPRVVLVANRERTRAVAESQDWGKMMGNSAPADKPMALSPFSPTGRRTAIGSVVLARWTKRRSSLSHLGAKLSRWARSIKKYGCTGSESQDVSLDPYLHPPGHDNKHASPVPSTSKDSKTNKSSLSEWIGKEAAASGTPETSVSRPLRMDRSPSDASEDIRVLS